MKKTLVALLVLGGLAMATEQPITLTLPGSVVVPKDDVINKIATGYSAQNILDKVKEKDFGYYVGFVNGDVAGNWGQQGGEGTWTNTDNVGSAVLAGRSGADGEGFGIVVTSNMLTSTITPGTKVTELTFSFDIPTVTGLVNGSQSYKYGIAVYDAEGAEVTKANDGLYTVHSDSQPASLSVSVQNIDWLEGYKIAAVVKGVSAAPPTNTYTIGNIKLTATVASVPEPTTGTLSLLALAGLCIRRRK